MTQINNISESTPLQPRQRQSVSPEAGFQETLQSALAQKPGSSAGDDAPAPLGEPQSIFNQSFSPGTATGIADQTDSLLNLLESYADGLENPNTTLKDLASMVDRIRDEAQQLMASADENTSTGSELRNIAAQTALTANVEYIKFQRGDFL